MLTIPNILTLVRIALVPVFLYASFHEAYVAAFVVFVTAAITDVFDGMIARRFNQKSKIGAILDPAADKMMMVGGFLYYTLAVNLPRTGIPGWLTFVVFIRDFLIMTFAYLMYTRGNVRRFPPSWAGKLTTVLQAVTLAAAIAVNGFLPRLLHFTEVLFHVALVITLFSAWDYLRRAERLLSEGIENAERA